MTTHRLRISAAYGGLLAVMCFGAEQHVNAACSTQVLENDSAIQTEADRVREQMRGFSMLLSPGGRISREEQQTLDIHQRMRELGPEVLPALVRALSDPDVEMRRNAAFMMAALARAFWPDSQQPDPRLDIRPARGALISATADADAAVRAWAAKGLGEIGPDVEIISTLLRLLQDGEEMARSMSCEALGRMGPAAKTALPALQDALKDPSPSVRRSAQRAIDQIDKP